jgi:hypothetical protein
MAIFFLSLKNPFVGFDSPFSLSLGGENSPQKKTLFNECCNYQFNSYRFGVACFDDDNACSNCY